MMRIRRILEYEGDEEALVEHLGHLWVDADTSRIGPACRPGFIIVTEIEMTKVAGPGSAAMKRIAELRKERVRE